MKLELKHLAPYLPYGLNFLTNKNKIKYGEQTSLKSRGFSLDDDGNIVVEFLYKDDLIFSNQMKSCQPILRPLTEIEDYFKKLFFEADEETTKYIDAEYLDTFGDMRIDNIMDHKIEYIPVGTYNLLLREKFDVFGLIEKGLAIDINTLPQE